MPDLGVQIDTSLVRRLLASQFPRWADHPIEPVASGGTDNAIFRLGTDMCVRLPRVDWAVEQVEKEQRWLPTLGPLLPFAVPEPLEMGRPDAGYPWKWSVYRWLDGENPAIDGLVDPHQAATDLARFVDTLRQIDPAGGPAPGTHNFFRGVPLATRDEATRDAIASLADTLDVAAVTDEWERALAAPAWQSAPVWIHGDLQAGNLLAREGRLTAVIDFGGLGVGDPACDMIVAWSFLPAEIRDVFRATLSVDDATWARGRGWALSVSLIALPYYRGTNPVIVATAEHTIREVMMRR